ncbi:MAG TPA: hypothetical protein DCS07_01955 [Bdellovibrionales bacterium]|nr:MAG: hypothetical protein A2Z97_06535 [Bdellovibrionales bacterium GWB1_52_6]OFZ05139.1 MAG: hypothetical protein A2X97_09300 [Bdellovibrionales bacterium GWA1_52_35]OFZ39848.1 MAG: hypothetical protein A2070_04560 [Bdellovibrionales bacterium GWC1_52_8]HAR41388.1 hypothetical protein [Bdellovibrionales bacterium]HCM38889.1 hypothetical protein [Bdellovibrionales bacterium]
MKLVSVPACLLLLGAAANLAAAADLNSPNDLKNGLYVPLTANNSSVCPQEVRTFRQNGRLTAIKVAYVGDCYYSGPFEYYCAETPNELRCSSPGMLFVIRDSTHYLWINETYDIFAEFELE